MTILKIRKCFCLSESKSRLGIEIDGFTVFNLENRTEDYPLPGIHGLQVYISNDIADSCAQIHDNNFECNLVIWVRIKYRFILGSLYLRLEKSRYHIHNIHKEKTLFEHLSSDISRTHSKYDMPLLLNGDFNCRTGLRNEIMLLESHDNKLDDSHFKYPNIIDIFNSLNIPVSRTNKNPTTNNNGKDLIDLCKLHKLCIINGRVETDRNVGDLKCAGAQWTT